MLRAPSRLRASHDALMSILRTGPDLRSGPALDAARDLLARRRTLPLTDLPPVEQAALVAARTVTLLPSVSALRDLLGSGRRLTVKYGIDPTAADVHIGHAVPILVAGRLQRMGHRVVLIVGDVTARIGDPSGRTADRPPLTDVDVRRNMATYREQIGRFFDVAAAELRHNSEWLSGIALPRFLGVLAGVPASAALQREDFRTRLAAGSGLTLAELVYAVVMALDSVEVAADVELGGLDQLLNMRMCRRVMEAAGQPPEVVLATGLIEGTDGSGAKMSKSAGNYVGVSFPAADVFGRLMSAPDRLLPDYLRSLTELLDPEVELLVRPGHLHPMGVKTLLACDVTAAVHGTGAATRAAAAFAARFSRRRLSEAADLPVVDLDRHAGATVGDVLVRLTGAVGSLNQVRRVADGGGLRLVAEAPGAEPTRSALTRDEVGTPVGALAAARRVEGTRLFLRCGRAVVELR